MFNKSRRQVGYLLREPRSHSMSTVKGKWQFCAITDLGEEETVQTFTQDSKFHEICHVLLVEGNWEFAGTGSEDGTNIFYRDRPDNGDM